MYELLSPEPSALVTWTASGKNELLKGLNLLIVTTQYLQIKSNEKIRNKIVL